MSQELAFWILTTQSTSMAQANQKHCKLVDFKLAKDNHELCVDYS